MLAFAVGVLGILGPWAAPAHAHTSEQAFVLLLPTELYITGGCLAVIVSILVISLTPRQTVQCGLASFPLPLRMPSPMVLRLTSLLAGGLFWALVAIGLFGSRDPLVNALPLVIWTGWWIALYTIAGAVGNPWGALNPWSGLYHLLFGRRGRAPLRLPDGWHCFPALLIMGVFCAFSLADPAPNDPARLARIVAAYWAFTFVGMALFGEKPWLRQCEAFSVLFRLIGLVAPLGYRAGMRIGLWGWQLAETRRVSPDLALFALVILAIGSFDGLKDTFWWLSWIGVNPLEFPGRSAVQLSSLVGMVLSIIALVIGFAFIAWSGAHLANRGSDPEQSVSGFALFCAFAPTLLPIALVYHTSHYLVSFLVDGQYLLAALGDPLARGANLFGLGEIHITTGFLNTKGSVRLIWLSQAFVVVAGHMVSVVVAHHIALSLYPQTRRALLAQVPLGLFVVGYTWFGLWLLAAPRAI